MKPKRRRSETDRRPSALPRFARVGLRSCRTASGVSKLRYETRAQAKAVRATFPVDSQAGLHIYRCPVCDYFHLGHDHRKDVHHVDDD